MPLLRIPPEHQAGLVKLALLPREVASELRTALSEATRREGINISAEDLAPVSGVPHADIAKIAEAVVGLNLARVYSDTDLDSFVTDVTDSMRSAAPSGLPTTKDSIAQFKKRIQAFLTIDEISQSAKTNLLRHEHERSVHSLRILTDIRPIFGNNVEEPPKGVVVMHTLKMAYHSGSSRLEEAFFGMDETDLRNLKEAVVRAELKAKSIRTALGKAQLKVINEE